MKLPTKLLSGTPEENHKFFKDMTILKNIIWQSERKTLKDCERVTEEIILFLFKQGYL